MGDPEGAQSVEARSNTIRLSGDEAFRLGESGALPAISGTAGQTGEGKDWYLLCPRMSRDRADKLRQYARRYFEPVVEAYPELKGRVYLALRKQGWLAEHRPVLHIIVREEDLDRSSPWRIRSITAHELSHLVQFSHGLGLHDVRNKGMERQATFHSFARGFASDFLRAFPAECTRQPCDHRFVFGYFRCDGVFAGCCRHLTGHALEELAQQLRTVAQAHDTWEPLDFVGLLSGCLVRG